MPRGPRLVLPDVPLHLVQRGVNRQPCFFAPRDYADYLRLLSVFADEYGCVVHAYCLMTNHVHLLLTPSNQRACARMMKQLNQCYVQRLNRAMRRSGTLWQGRFHSSVVATETYVLTCYRYIELNPVRAGLVAHARDYQWSSYRANAEGEDDSIVSMHGTYQALGDSLVGRASAYRTLFELALPETDAEAIRRATRGGYRIGEERRRRGRQPRGQEVDQELPGPDCALK